ncbi:MAG: pentapeptide repeat-containing protein [Gammaproteobacteria bacterium]|nr:pentapeptide repeat-containing protein [Gammaproteobacteria bacterium]
MKKRLSALLIQPFMLFLLSMLLTAYMASVNAWTKDIETLDDANTLCKLEPDAQCTSAVRVGLQAPGVDMHDATMEAMRLDGANLQGANFQRSIMQLANLKGANLMMANLEGAHMHATNLQNANLMMANMQKVNLLDADLRGANLRGANLTGAILIQAKFENATWTDGRVCAAGSVGECL